MLSSKTVFAAIGAIVLITASGCNTTPQSDQTTTQPDQTTSPTTTSPSAQQNSTQTVSDVDRQFAIAAAQGGLAEVQLGQLANQKAASSDVKQYGQQMVQDHTQANNQLKQLAAQKNITLPQAPNDQQQAAKANLTQLSGTSFDQAYMAQMVKDHEQTVALFRQEAQQGQDPDLKAWASKTLPILEKHTSMAQSMAGSPSDGATPKSSP